MVDDLARGGLRTWHLGAVSVLALGVGWLAGTATAPESRGEVERSSLEVHRLTSPFLECPGVMDADLSLVEAKRAVSGFIIQARERDPSLQVSMYARDLNNGPWVGIDEAMPFVSASLAKVPVMIYQLALAEGDSSFLEREVIFRGSESMDSGGVPEGQRMRAGEAYRVSDLLLRMIAFSDNDARALLMEGVPPAAVNAMTRTFHADMSLEGGQWVTSARSYAALFRILYNATFLGRAMSEYALSLLSQSHYQGALRRFIPEGVTIASKYGYFRNGSAGHEQRQFHECGIVYEPGHPYLLCVMTRSDLASQEELAEIVANVSRIIWQVTTRGS